MSKVSDLESRRDVLAADVATLQARLDLLDGSEELTAVQKMSNDLDAGTRLLAALDRQIAQARETQRLAVVAAQEAAIEAAIHECTKLDRAAADKLQSVYDLIEQRRQLTDVSPRLAGKSQRMRTILLQLMEMTGCYDLAIAPGREPFPVRR